MAIKNVVFDIGNVLVKWSPLDIVKMTFGEDCNAEELVDTYIHNQVFWDLNRGRFSLQTAKHLLVNETEHTLDEIERLFDNLFLSLTPVAGGFELLQRLHKAGYRILTLTDNVHEIVAYLKETYEFWPYFDGGVVSADVDLLKPEPEIYQTLIEKCQIIPQESVFMDDMPNNVLGAKDKGLHAFQFTTAQDAEMQLKKLGLKF